MTTVAEAEVESRAGVATDALARWGGEEFLSKAGGIDISQANPCVRADLALDRAKANGRNQVVCA